MNELSRQEQSDAAYLSAALHWLRARLEQKAPRVALAHVGKKWWPLGRTAVLALPPGPDERAGKDAEAEMERAAGAEPPPSFLTLCNRCSLSRFERETLLLCVAMELDTRIAGLCARAQDDPSRPYPTFALAMALFDDPAWDALSPHRPLRYWRLLEINQPGAQPLTTAALRADERIVSYVKGLNFLDHRLSPFVAPLGDTCSPESLAPSQEELVRMIVRFASQCAGSHRAPMIEMLGPHGESKREIAVRAASALSRATYRLPAETLPTQAAELETFVRIWERESALLPIALYLDTSDWERAAAGEAAPAAVNRLLDQNSSLLFLDTRERWPHAGESVLSLDVGKPTAREQQDAWSQALGPEAASLPGELAGQFNLSLTEIRRIAGETADSSGDTGSLEERVWQACLVSTRPRMDTLAQRLDAKAAWKDIVLPEPELRLLHQIADQVSVRSQVYDDWGFRSKMNRGLGISALFAGESGTGKTMAAEVIANDLRLNLYRIDLSAVVSKYIGETEKNLRRLFDAAEDGGAILFFDEADALFGKRSEVKDSHDRYANIEVNYLLQRMEAFQGLAILATNMKSAMDSAFLRRLRFVVTFPFPGPEQRKEIWRKAFPDGLKEQVEKLDFDRLSRLNVTGGSIHNVALNAAFLAAHKGTELSMPLVLEAARNELRKLDRPINEADFRWEEPPKPKTETPVGAVA